MTANGRFVVSARQPGGPRLAVRLRRSRRVTTGECGSVFMFRGRQIGRRNHRRGLPKLPVHGTCRTSGPRNDRKRPLVVTAGRFATTRFGTNGARKNADMPFLIEPCWGCDGRGWVPDGAATMRSPAHATSMTWKRGASWRSMLEKKSGKRLRRVRGLGSIQANTGSSTKARATTLARGVPRRELAVPSAWRPAGP